MNFAHNILIHVDTQSDVTLDLHGTCSGTLGAILHSLKQSNDLSIGNCIDHGILLVLLHYVSR